MIKLIKRWCGYESWAIRHKSRSLRWRCGCDHDAHAVGRCAIASPHARCVGLVAGLGRCLPMYGDTSLRLLHVERTAKRNEPRTRVLRQNPQSLEYKTAFRNKDKIFYIGRLVTVNVVLEFDLIRTRDTVLAIPYA